jgi:hypothetical protein
MLNHLRQRAAAALAAVRTATLSTCGPAHIQASVLPCEAVGLRFYMLAPRISDHLFNLESESEVVVTTADWQLRGTASVLDETASPSGLQLTHMREAQWSRLVEIHPVRLHMNRLNGWAFGETLDIEDDDKS